MCRSSLCIMNTNLLWIIYSKDVPPVCVLPGHSFIGVVRQRSPSFSCHRTHQSFPFRVSADCLLVKKFFLPQGHKYICLYFLLKSFKVLPFKPNCLILKPLIFFFEALLIYLKLLILKYVLVLMENEWSQRHID